TASPAPAVTLDCQKAYSLPLAVDALERPRYLNPLEYFDTVAGTDIVVVLHTDATFHAVAHFRDVILETTQGFQLAFINHHVLAQNADRAVTVDGAFDDHTASDITELGRTEHVAHFGHTQ